jgi:hypothetical protein
MHGMSMYFANVWWGFTTTIMSSTLLIPNNASCDLFAINAKQNGARYRISAKLASISRYLQQLLVRIKLGLNHQTHACLACMEHLAS